MIVILMGASVSGCALSDVNGTHPHRKVSMEPICSVQSSKYIETLVPCSAYSEASGLPGRPLGLPSP